VVPPPNSKFWVLPAALVVLLGLFWRYYLANLWVTDPRLADYIFGAMVVVAVGLFALRSYEVQRRQAKS